MTTVAEVLRRSGFDLSETEVADYLAVLLSPAATSVDLSAADEHYLTAHAGVLPASPEQLIKLQVRSAARAALEAGHSLTRTQVAERLGVDASRVSHQVTQGKLYAYSVAHRPLFPDWQFLTDDEKIGERPVLPHLGELLAALPQGSHPMTIRTFMEMPDGELTIKGEPTSPRQWLLSGGEPSTVVDLAGTLGEQV